MQHFAPSKVHPRILAERGIFDIPRALPIDLYLSVIVAYEPADHRFKIMSQHSETGSRSPSPVIADSKPLKFEALLYKSTITTIDKI